MRGKCSEELVSGVWEMKCIYEKKDGWQDLSKNRCYEMACENNEWVMKERENATEWENECFEFNCDNDTGRVMNRLCSDSLICVNDKCVEKETLNEKMHAVKIGVEAFSMTEYNMEDVVEVLSKETDIEMGKLMITFEVDEYGQVMSVIVYVDDEHIAQAIENLVNECSSDDSSMNLRRKCEGVLLKFKSVKVTTKDFSEAPGIHSKMKILIITTAMMMMFMLV